MMDWGLVGLILSITFGVICIIGGMVGGMYEEIDKFNDMVKPYAEMMKKEGIIKEATNEPNSD